MKARRGRSRSLGIGALVAALAVLLLGAVSANGAFDAPPTRPSEPARSSMAADTVMAPTADELPAPTPESGGAIGDDPVDDEMTEALIVEGVPTGRVVLQLFQSGPVQAPPSAAESIPTATIWDDGRVIFPGADGTIRDGRLDPDMVARLVAAAGLLHTLPNRLSADPLNVPHGETTRFSVEDAGGRTSVSVYRLRLDAPAPNETDPVTFDRLRALWHAVVNALPAGAPSLRADNVVAEIQREHDGFSSTSRPCADVGAARDWPPALAGQLHGDAAHRAIELAGFGPGIIYCRAGMTHHVTIRPVLPDLAAPGPDRAFGVPARHPAATAYTVSPTGLWQPYRADGVSRAELAAWYRRAMVGQGWRLGREADDRLQVWATQHVAGQGLSTDRMVVLRFRDGGLTIQGIGVMNGLLYHPRGTGDRCGGPAPHGSHWKYCTVIATDAAEAERWYREHLPYLGWEEVRRNDYRRDARQMELELVSAGGRAELHVAQTNLPIPGLPPTPRPTTALP